MDDLESLFEAFGGGERGARASVFDQFIGGFGRGRRTAQPREAPSRGADEIRTIPITLEQAAHGATVTVRLGSKGNGPFETLDVKIPPGVEDGQRIRIRGRGHRGRHGGETGDFYLQVSIKPHPWFRSDGRDIYLELPVSVAEAALGASLEVPTLDEMVTLRIPAGTVGGSKLRLRGRGLPTRDSASRGDQYAVVQIVPPKHLTEELRTLFEQLREKETEDPRANCAWTRQTASES
jgi:DnaJ-class molecular chaperone